MSEYNEFVSRFPLQEKSVEKEGYEFHHIIPKSEQTEPDDRGVLLLPSEHLWAHVLYDRENGKETSRFMRTKCNLKLDDIHSYEDCLVYDKVAEAHREVQKRWAETHKGKKRVDKLAVVEDYKNGMTTDMIAKKHGCHRAYVYQVLNQFNLKRGGRNQRMTDQQTEIKALKTQITELQEENELFKSIIRKLTLQ